MNCLEKFEYEHGFSGRTPEAIISDMCPSNCGYLGKPDYCQDWQTFFEDCCRCWYREMPEKTEDTIEEKFTIATPVIKDSGDRTEFESGAVRDMREGKGRCDLMPLDVVAQVLGGPGDLISYDTVINDIHMFQKTGDTDYLYYALDRFASAAYGKTSTMLLETAIHFEDGAKKYGPNNWQKGIPVYCYIDSAVRHYLKFCRGDNDEPHNRAFCWNILCAIWTCINKPELNGYRKEE